MTFTPVTTELTQWLTSLPFLPHAQLALLAGALFLVGAGRSVRALIAKTY
jgi:hypothetical protein